MDFLIFFKLLSVIFVIEEKRRERKFYKDRGMFYLDFKGKFVFLIKRIVIYVYVYKFFNVYVLLFVVFDIFLVILSVFYL